MVASVQAQPARVAKFVALTTVPQVFTAGQPTSQTLPAVDPGFSWNELIVSWNVEPAVGTGLTIEARVTFPDHQTKWYTMGQWSLEPDMARQSVSGQKDEDGDVMTDTLHLVRPGGKVEVRLTGTQNDKAKRPRVTLIGLSFADTNAAELPPKTEHPAWGKVIDVPKKRQDDYPNGGVLCSPTSVAMVLAHWGHALNRPDVVHDVPEIQPAVFDPTYKGCGNWPFNMAYVGSLFAMRAYVTRLGSVDQLESWVDEQIPLVCSVSYDLLQGKPLSPTESGHLVVLVGFTKDGDPIFNDPAALDVRVTYKRADFEAAWSYSKRTVYVMYPRTVIPPDNSDGYWLESDLDN
jgi:hypothetical protein